jgi:hypothetical protein
MGDDYSTSYLAPPEIRKWKSNFDNVALSHCYGNYSSNLRKSKDGEASANIIESSESSSILRGVLQTKENAKYESDISLPLS